MSDCCKGIGAGGAESERAHAGNSECRTEGAGAAVDTEAADSQRIAVGICVVAKDISCLRDAVFKENGAVIDSCGRAINWQHLVQ